MSTTAKKVLSVTLSTTTALWLSGASFLVPVAHGQTVAELQAQIQALLQQIATLQAQLAALQGGQTTTTGGGNPFAACNFTRDLTVGSTGEDVRCLQQGLNAAGFKVAETGPGSPGNETTYFGQLTKAALIKFQEAHAAQILAPVGLSKGTGYFGPSTRSYIASLGTGTVVTQPGQGQGQVQPPATGLAISLAPDTPTSATVPKGASNVPYLKIQIAGQGTVNSIQFHRVGPGSASDFASSGVNLLDENGKRLTTGRSVNSTTHLVTFTGLNLSVSGVRTLTLVATMATGTVASAGDRNAFELADASAVNASESVSGQFPIRGNELAIAGASVGTITVETSTTPSNPKVGESDAKVASFKITNNSSSDDVTIRSLTLRYSGSAGRSKLSNFRVKYAGSVVATGDAIDSNDLLKLTFDPPFLLERGQNRTFELYVDVGADTRADDTIKFYVEDASDLFATSALYGYGAHVTNNWSTAQTVTIQGGQVTITFDGPVGSDIPTNGQDVPLFDFTIASQNNIEVRTITFNLSSTIGGGTNEKISDFKVVDRDTGAVVAGPYGSDIASGTTSVAFTDTFTVNAGQSRKLSVRADIGSSSNLANDTVQVSLAAFDSTDIRNLDNNTDVDTSDIVPNTTITGNTHTIKAPSLDVSLSGTPSSRTVARGSTNVDLVGIKFRATADDIQIRSITISASSQTTVANTKSALGTLRLMVNGNQIGQSKSLTGSSFPLTATFDNLDYTVPEGQSVVIVVNSAQISNNAPTSTYYWAGINSLSTGVTAVDSQGNTLSLSGSVNPTTSSPSVKVTVNAPTLTIERVGAGSSDTDAGYVIANGERVLTRLQMKADNGDVTVTKLQFGVSSGAANATSTGLADDVTGISLKQCATISCSSKTTIPGLTNLAIDATGNGAGHVIAENSSGFFTVPRGEERWYTIEGTLNSVQVGSSELADSGTDLYASLRESNFEAVSGSTKLTSYTTGTGGTALGVTGNRKILFRAEPTLSVATPTGAKLANGLVPVIDMTVGANGPSIALKAFGINITAANATVVAPTTSNVTVTDITGGGSTDITIGTVSGAAITGGNSGDIYIIFSSPEIITQGSPKTYRVKVTVTDAAGDTTDSLSTKLDRNETSVVNSTTTTSASLLTSSGDYGSNSPMWVWSDLSDDSAASESDTQWANAYLLRPFPSDTITVE